MLENKASMYNLKYCVMSIMNSNNFLDHQINQLLCHHLKWKKTLTSCPHSGHKLQVTNRIQKKMTKSTGLMTSSDKKVFLIILFPVKNAGKTSQDQLAESLNKLCKFKLNETWKNRNGNTDCPNGIVWSKLQFVCLIGDVFMFCWNLSAFWFRTSNAAEGFVKIALGVSPISASVGEWLDLCSGEARFVVE